MEQLERFINKVNKMREAQRYWFKHKNKLGDAKTLETEVDHMILAMLSKGYSIERFNKDQVKQTTLL